MDEAPHAFRFLSARQILELKEFAARQVLKSQPQEREASPEDENALIYVFVSHRWDEEGKPDKNGVQLETLQCFVKKVQELIAATTKEGTKLKWPSQLEDLEEGMPQAASLVTRIAERSASKARYEEMIQSPLDHIWFWYDCGCLPQKLTKERTEEEKAEFRSALPNLDWLISQCELLVLRNTNDDYTFRAWCSMEYFQKSLDDFEGRIELYCDKTQVDWSFQESSVSRLPSVESVDPTIRETVKHAHKALEEMRQKVDEKQMEQFQNLQEFWARFVEESEEHRMAKVPDLCRRRFRIRSIHVFAPDPPPMQQALELMVKELYSVIFCLSCREAAQLAGRAVPANSGACIPNVGIKCGLHHATTPIHQDRLQQCIASSPHKFQFDICTDPVDMQAAQCPRGHGRLLPRLSALRRICSNPDGSCDVENKEVDKGALTVGCASCDFNMCFHCAMSRMGLLTEDNSDTSQAALEMALGAYGARFPIDMTDELDSTAELCERVVTVDLYEVVTLVLSSYKQKCTNKKDVALVGMLALRNLIGNGPHGTRTCPRLSAGPLTLFAEVFQSAVNTLSSAVDSKEDIKSLQLTISIRVPRWVLLDMSNSRTLSTTSLLMDNALSFGTKAQQYFESNPGCISFSFGQDNGFLLPVRLKHCDVDKCYCSWSLCQHRTQLQLQTQLNLYSTNSTLDSWTSTEFPTTLECFGCAAIGNRIIVAGGSVNDDLASCSAETYITSVTSWGQADRRVWQRISRLNEARFNHASCALRSNKGTITSIAMGGGRDDNRSILSSIEILQLDDLKSGWMSCLTMPFGRKSHHMASLGGCLFIFGGITEDPSHEQDCDIYNFNLEVWMKGPAVPRPFAGGGHAVVLDRYAIVVGGMHGQCEAMNNSWVLDLQPWADWSSKGGNEDQRPGVTWIPGPDFPAPSNWTNICVASSADIGRSDDWVLSVSSTLTGNTCYGIRVTADDVKHDADGFWRQAQWQKLGATPESTILGRCVVAGSNLMMICGQSNSTGVPSRTIYYRKLSTEDSVPLRGMTDFEPGCEYQPLLDQRILTNDIYLLGRLGFPITEDLLFACDGTKKLLVLPPPKDNKSTTIHCQRCLFLTQSLDRARESAAPHFGLRANASADRIPFCSSCLCALYYD